MGKGPGKSKRRSSGDRWSAREVETLRREWGEVGQRVLCQKLRPRSWIAIIQKAYAIGLPFGIPQGWASIKEAAERSGFHRSQIVKICRRNDVQIRLYPLRCYRTPSGARGRWRIVEWDALRDAIDHENASLPPSQRGLAANSLRVADAAPKSSS
jgi:hypothetical protein